MKVITAWAEEARGPGWHNNIVWALVRDSFGELRIEAIQPDQQTPVMLALHGVSATMAKTMTREAAKVLTLEVES